MHSFSAVIDDIKMIAKTKTTLLMLGMVLAGCSTETSPKTDTVESIQQKCSVILSSHVPDDQRWQVYNDLLQEYLTYRVFNQADFDRFNAFIQAVQTDETGQLITELMEVTDWGCSNGNYLEEMDMFISEVQK